MHTPVAHRISGFGVFFVCVCLGVGDGGVLVVDLSLLKYKMQLVS